MKGESSPPAVFTGPGIGTGASHSEETVNGGNGSVAGVPFTASAGIFAYRSSRNGQGF